jgi:hypothetical protein
VAVVNELKAFKTDPYVAAILVSGSGWGDFHLPGPDDRPLRISEIYDDDEILEATFRYLQFFPRSSYDEGWWGWIALLNGWEQLEPEVHARLLIRLVGSSAVDESDLRLIADGPLINALASEQARAVLDRRAPSDPKVAHAIGLARTIEQERGRIPKILPRPEGGQ